MVLLYQNTSRAHPRRENSREIIRAYVTDRWGVSTLEALNRLRMKKKRLAEIVQNLTVG